MGNSVARPAAACQIHGRAAPHIVDLLQPQAIDHRPNLDDQRPPGKMLSRHPCRANVTCFGTRYMLGRIRQRRCTPPCGSVCGKDARRGQ